MPLTSLTYFRLRRLQRLALTGRMIVLALCAVVAAIQPSPAVAGPLTGQTIGVTTITGNQAGVVEPPVAVINDGPNTPEFTILWFDYPPLFAADLGGDRIILRMLGWPPPFEAGATHDGYHSITFTDVNGTIPNFTSATLVNTSGVPGFAQSGISFDANSVTLLVGSGVFWGPAGSFIEIQVGTGAPSPQTLTALGPAKVWIGLKNSDDQGTRYDLRTEVYINNALVSEGITRCITGVTRNPSNAKEVAVPFGAITNGALEPGNSLSLRVLTRIGTNPDDSKCPGHNNAVGLRLYYNAASRPSSFGVEIAPDPLTDFFLDADDLLDDEAPTAIAAQFKDSASVNFAGGNPWKEIGTWIMILP